MNTATHSDTFLGGRYADSTLGSADHYRLLYEAEHEKVRGLEGDLLELQVQTRIYARDLSNVYQHAKGKRRELAQVNSQLLKYAEDLRESMGALRKSNLELSSSYVDTLRRLSVAAEYRDEGTGDHIMRMAYYGSFLAAQAGLPGAEVRNLFHALPMHDVGKIGIPDHIIKKPARLNTDEFLTMQAHTTIGANILADSSADILQLACQVALSHHERWDGEGYPHGLRGEAIPLTCRIASLADVFDALTSRRPYKEAFSIDKATDTILKSSGRQFDPGLTRLFMDNLDTLCAIMHAINEGDMAHANAFFPTPLEALPPRGTPPFTLLAS